LARRAAFALLALALPSLALAPPPDPRIDRVERWLNAVAQHEPGQADDAVAEIASWSSPEMRMLWIDVSVLVQLMRNPNLTSFTIKSQGPRPTAIRYTPNQLARLRAIAGKARLLGDRNIVLRRGALLHTDTAIENPSRLEPFERSPAIGPSRVRVNISDGRSIEVGSVAVHWELARMLLDYVESPDTGRPSPARDDMVRAWYRATIAWMELREDHEIDHVDHAYALFPNDPDVLFLTASLHETFATPYIQGAVRSAVLPAGFSFGVGSDRSELRKAEGLFRRALAARPAFAEAHLRLGRVLMLLGQPTAAAAELREALATTTDDSLLPYYGHLFLGAAEEALARFGDARAAYERAAALYPAAQSPLLALSELARRQGDRRGALAAMDRVFALPHGDSELDDPWWKYHVAQGRHAQTLLEDLWKPFRR
jgi:tetratricopeptide (TPR) repeat protein